MTRDNFFGIADAEHATGIARATLRIWERRYGFPQPTRSGSRERTYPPDQIEKLKLIQRLLDKGVRPGRVIALSTEKLQELVQTKAAAAPGITSFDEPLLQLLRTHDNDGLRRSLSHMLLELGLHSFVTDKVVPLVALLRKAMEVGEIRVFQDRLYVEILESVLRNAIFNFPPPATSARPRVLLATFPEDPHALGLLTLQAMATLEGCPNVSLGVKLPVGEIAAAAEAHSTDVVGLSFTLKYPPKLVVSGLQELRQKLTDRVGIWVVGDCPVLHSREIEGVVPFIDVAAFRTALAGYREAQ